MQAARSGRERQVYTSDGVRKVCGVVPVLPDGQIVMVSSAKRVGDFILPKGGAETDETAPQSAIREAFEEAGIRGTLRPNCLCSFRNEKVNKETGLPTSEFHFYIMDVTSLESDWPEAALRTRATFTPSEALDILLKHKSNSLYVAMQAYITSQEQ
ncbi:hypothetical protein BCR33DRAFT_421988 [Rhizoclosmatium globosum]|uniref:Nudix hydrolase domain-containing protein n=1 Tax=Rhizoclosmatium globosum TaxID=329046 RepID=A0A1Y2BVN1_9FUNG|nr:hypothetical protein HDU79_000903 [Rhizoclosmatium sp. JEL0117]ORY38838.1 hypothetical protein BCR33DRAFT_421988 [Rhizoclosmatium globosum]|eukprot:ORY38838.1 hypothetical protein BCR33DRAFT_421988 [Rhizoclosmatium globosum]